VQGEDIVSVFESEGDGVVDVSVAVIFSRASFKDRSSFAVTETSLLSSELAIDEDEVVNSVAVSFFSSSPMSCCSCDDSTAAPPSASIITPPTCTLLSPTFFSSVDNPTTPLVITFVTSVSVSIFTGLLAVPVAVVVVVAAAAVEEDACNIS